MIDARINMYQKADANEPFYQGAIAALRSLGEELQMSIEADIAAMESNTGE
jgi:pyruvate-formate lyase